MKLILELRYPTSTSPYRTCTTTSKGTPRVDIVGCRVPLFGHFWLWCSLVVLFPLLDIVGCGVPLLTGWSGVVNLAFAVLLLRHLHKVQIYMKCFYKLKKRRAVQLPRENRQLSGVAPPPSDVEGQLDKVKARLHQCFVIFLVFLFFPPFVFTFFLADFLTHRGLVSGKRACAGKFQRFN